MMTSQATAASSSPAAGMEGRVDSRERDVLEMGRRRVELSSSRHRARTQSRKPALTAGGVVLLAKDSWGRETEVNFRTGLPHLRVHTSMKFRVSL